METVTTNTTYGPLGWTEGTLLVIPRLPTFFVSSFVYFFTWIWFYEEFVREKTVLDTNAVKSVYVE